MIHPLLLQRGEHFNGNFYYFSGIDVDYAFFLAEGKKRTLLVPKMGAALARKLFTGRIVVYEDFIEVLKRRLAGKKVFVDGTNLSARTWKRLRTFCNVVDATELLYEKRRIKLASEVAHIRKAVQLTKKIINNIDLSGCITEQDVANQLLCSTFEAGLEPAFSPIVAADSNTAFPHYKNGKKKIRDFVLVDYGVRYRHYCGDITRCFFIRKDQKKLTMYERLKEILNEIVDNMANFRTGNELAAFSEKLLKKHNMSSLHSIGHGIGLDVHEWPRLSKKYMDNISGSTMAIEPAFYNKHLGMRYEETIYFDGKRARVL